MWSVSWESAAVIFLNPYFLKTIILIFERFLIASSVLIILLSLVCFIGPDMRATVPPHSRGQRFLLEQNLHWEKLSTCFWSGPGPGGLTWLWSHCGSASALRLPQQPSQKGQIGDTLRSRSPNAQRLPPSVTFDQPKRTSDNRWMTRRLIWMLMSVPQDSGESAAARSGR